MSSIADIRQDYKLKQMLEEDMYPDPFDQFNAWWDEVLKAEITEPNAMTLCTASADAVPSARIVLLKGIGNGGFMFFTNYNSYKAKDLADNPRACLVFFWKELERQVRVTGVVEKTDAKTSEDYFDSRPAASRIGAWASPQSQTIESRNWLEKNNEEFTERFESNPLVRPAYWGGYILKPVTIEFWQGRRNRLHDRIQYQLLEGNWKIERLAP